MNDRDMGDVLRDSWPLEMEPGFSRLKSLTVGKKTVDVISKKQRSELMSRIRSSRTQVELVLKSFLEQAAIPFQYQPSMKGRPDFLVNETIAVFVNGCFWHGCSLHYREPKTNVGYWRKKVLMNEVRLRKNKSALRRRGFKVLSFWEHEVEENLAKCIQKVRRTLSVG